MYILQLGYDILQVGCGMIEIGQANVYDMYRGGIMKLILKENPDAELTVTVEYPNQNSQVLRIIQKMKTEERFLIGSENGRSYKILVPDIFYIESVDKRTFMYTKEMIFRSEKRLYQLERELKEYDFVKVSRTCLLNVNELVHIKMLSNSRLEAELSNGEKIIVSRTYISEIKRKLFEEVQK